jgi:hypothetical protein
MAIDRNDQDERVSRLQSMIDEFELTQRRRLIKAEPRVGRGPVYVRMPPIAALPPLTLTISAH